MLAFRKALENFVFGWIDAFVTNLNNRVLHLTCRIKSKKLTGRPPMDAALEPQILP
jgi:hypothetical protein